MNTKCLTIVESHYTVLLYYLVVSPDPNRAAAIIGGATGAILGILLLAIIIAIIAVRAKYIWRQAMGRMRYNIIIIVY